MISRIYRIGGGRFCALQIFLVLSMASASFAQAINQRVRHSTFVRHSGSSTDISQHEHGQAACTLQADTVEWWDGGCDERQQQHLPCLGLDHGPNR